MIIYFDSSALVKSFVEEEGSTNVKNFLSELAKLKEIVVFATSAITKAEIMAALSAMRRGRHLTQTRFQKAVADFQKRWEAYSRSHNPFD